MENKKAPKSIIRKEEKIRLATSIPSLKDKIKVDLDGELDTVYWYIRFNVPLDEKTVSHKSMDVTDTEGYIMRTDIHYNKEINRIVITPLDSYEQNRYYLLNISNKVRSAGGKQLRVPIHIMFKLMDNQISEYEILKSTVKVPKPKPRPANYGAKNTTARVYTFENDSTEDQLKYARIKFNPFLGIIGLVMAFASFFISAPVLTVGSAVIALGGILHIVLQIIKKELRSLVYYNLGAWYFNEERYKKAQKALNKASRLDPQNEMAEYAVSKIGFYV